VSLTSSSPATLAREAVAGATAQIGLVHAGPAHRERQHHEGVTKRRGDVQRRGSGSRAGQSNGVPSGSPPRALRIASLPSSSSDSSSSSSEEPPRVRTQAAVRQLDIRLEVTVVLLQMLRLRKVPSDQMTRFSQLMGYPGDAWG
jgi:hypothetical protein